MIEIAASHQLYFYQLLSSHLGAGKQVQLSQIDEVLAAEDVAPADVGAADVAELLESLPAFVRLTAFKRGRVVATVLRNDELDEALERAARGGTTPKAVRGKPWKAKGTKVVMPAKPKPAPGRVTASGAASATMEATGMTAGTDGLLGTPAPEASGEGGRSARRPEPDEHPSHEAATPAPAAANVQAGSGATTPAGMPAAAGTQAAGDALSASHFIVNASVFSLEGDGLAAADGDAGGRPEEEGATTDATDTEKAGGSMADGAPASGGNVRQDEGRATNADVSATRQDQGAVTDADAEEPAITLTITYDPTKEARAPQPDATTAGERTAHPRRAEATVRTRAKTEPQADTKPCVTLPTHFSDDVYCSNAVLAKLCATLPLGANYLALLDEAWEKARQEVRRTTDPISFAVTAEGRQAATATIRRRPPTPSGRRWELVGVAADTDADDMR